jgi:hypothetical protein
MKDDCKDGALRLTLPCRGRVGPPQAVRGGVLQHLHRPGDGSDCTAVTPSRSARLCAADAAQSLRADLPPPGGGAHQMPI